MSELPPGEEHDKMLAAVEMIRRTGASSFQIRYSDDEQPVIWFAVAEYNGKNPAGIEGHEVDAALDPVRATLRLCERLVDGGMCLHCGRPTGLDPDSLDTMPMNEMICWTQFDPELKTFRRGCEGDTASAPG